MTWSCEKALCTDLKSDPTLHQNSTGVRRQTRTSNTIAEHVVTNLITLEHCRVKKLVSPSTPTCWRRTPSSRSRRNTISHRETQTQQTKENREEKKGNVSPLSVCLMLNYVTLQLCSLNELLTPLPWADVSTGKLDSRFPVNKPQVLQEKVCWNNSSCYKSTNSPSGKNIIIGPDNPTC